MSKKDIEANNVPSDNQVKQHIYTETAPDAKFKILFAGNSITIHDPAPDIGWHGNWGMAASAKEKDYVHVLKSMLSEKYGAFSMGVLQAAKWERSFWEDNALENDGIEAARDFDADIIVIRLGENAHPFAKPERDFGAALEKLAAYLNKSGKARIIITDMFWQSEILDNPIRETAQKNGWTLVHIGDLGTKDENKALGLFEHHGVAIHPGDAGMKHIAQRIFEVI